MPFYSSPIGRDSKHEAFFVWEEKEKNWGSKDFIKRLPNRWQQENEQRNAKGQKDKNLAQEKIVEKVQHESLKNLDSLPQVELPSVCWKLAHW